MNKLKNIKKTLTASLTVLTVVSVVLNAAPQVKAADGWAFEETFDGDPSSPSQALLPSNFDFEVTHRSHPKEHFTKQFGPYPADHGSDCTGPNPSLPSSQTSHQVISSHNTNGSNPDKSFFVCKNHMMSSMGDVEGYTVASFWPKQEFNFADGGVLEFDSNINDGHSRSWYEVMITPRDQLKVGAAFEAFPIDETHPADAIVLGFGVGNGNSRRRVVVSKDLHGDAGHIVDEKSVPWRGTLWNGKYYNGVDENDPALDDRRIRRTHRITIQNNQINWAIEKQDGTFDDFVVDVPGGIPFDQGVVVFKTHAYTPEKDGNYDKYTFHWDNIRFDGPVVGKFESLEADRNIYLQAGHSREIGEQESNSISLPSIGQNPVLFGQVHNPINGQVLLSINGNPYTQVDPFEYGNGGCFSSGWKSFRFPLDSSLLVEGQNTFDWKIGPRPACVDSIAPRMWDGFSVKGMEIQFDLDDSGSSGGGDTGDGGDTGSGGDPGDGGDSGNGGDTTLPLGAFRAEYFDNKDFSGESVVEEVATINYVLDQGSPNAQISSDTFSAIWEGRFEFEAGNYDFDVTADDGVRVYLDDVMIIDGWKDQAATNYISREAVTAGEHVVKVEYYENFGGSVIQFDWEKVETVDTPAGQLNTFVASYYNGINFDSLRHSEVVTEIINNWGSGSPHANVSNDLFSAVWEGQFDFDRDTYVFEVVADDGIKVFVDGNPIIEGWVDQAPTRYITEVVLSAGTHDIRVEYYERYGGSVIDLDWYKKAQDSQSGLNQFSGRYYQGKNFNILRSTNTVNKIDFDWGKGSPATNIPVDQFSAKWEGTFEFAESGLYEFTTTSDDGIRLYIDGDLVIDEWNDHAIAQHSVQLDLTAGTHDIVVMYYENWVDSIARLEWVKL